jgi:acyl-CoA thioesterase FadM
MIDIGYFIRSKALRLRHQNAKPKRNLFSELVTFGRCWPSDIDSNMHMNNSRYLREADFGRILFNVETGLVTALYNRRKKDPACKLLVGAIQVQYRQSIELGDRFTLRTRIVGWDDRAVYYEQEFTLDKNQQVACCMIVREVVTPRSLSPQMLVDDLGQGPIESPVLPPDVEIFKQNHRLTYSSPKSKL